MSRIIIVGESKEIKELTQGLPRAGLSFTFVPPAGDIVSQIGENVPDLVIFEVSHDSTPQRVDELSQEIRHEMSLPVLVIVPRRLLFNLSSGFAADDFIVLPSDEREFVLRIRRLLRATGGGDSDEVVKGGDLVIDTAKAEVTLSGSRIDLTYREYELLRFLMSNKGRVFTREALLDKVWGYDYYGGDRTVDVHVRRLRSKIEITGKTYIETVRSIGYRFREDA